jgi:ankyrin repeat protein
MNELMCAAAQGNVEDVKTLLANGASANVADENGMTALKLAVIQASSPDFVEIVRLLLAAGADVAHGDLHDNTAIHLTILCRDEDTATQILPLLIEAASPDVINRRNDIGDTALYMAIQSYKDDLAEILDEAGGVE